MEIEQAIALMLDSEPPFYRLKMRQGDTARQMTASIYENTRAWVIPEGTGIEFRAKKPDGTKVVRSEGITYSGNTVTVPLTANTLAAPGNAVCELVFSDAAGGVLGTVNFVLEVWPAVVPMSDIESRDDYQSLTQAVADAQQAANAAASGAAEAAEDVATIGNSVEQAAQSASAAAQSAQQAAESVASIGDSVEQAAASASAAAESASEAAADAAEVSQKVDGFRGSFENPAALREAYPTSANGDWAVVQDNRSIWVYDAALSLWVESGSSYNYLINPGFLINQRGKESYNTVGVGLDLWWNNFIVSEMGMTLTAEEVEGQPERAAVVRCEAVTAASTHSTVFFQQIEDVNGKSLVAGKRVTLSFYYKTAVDYRTLFAAYKPEGSEEFTVLQKPLAASPDEYVQAYYTVDIPEGATAVQFGAGNSRNLTSADNGSEFRLTRPQVVEGDSPRTWEPVDMASEMVKCQRFYEKINFCFGTAYNSTLLWLSMPFKVEKAKTPTVSYGVGNTPNVVQALRPSGSQNLPLREGALTGDSKGIYFNGNLLDSGVAVTDVGTWFCYVEAEVPF